MYINKIIKMKDNKYKLIIDDKTITTYDSVILENNLLYKKSINSSLYNKIVNDTTYYDIYNRVVKYILKRKRSKKEVKDYLSKFDINEYEIKKILSKLESIKLIDDIEYCKSYINDKIYLGKVGINKIKDDLIKQNISIDIINKYIDDIDNDLIINKLESIIIKKINLNSKYSNLYLKQKILQEMLNKGYNKKDVLRIINENLKDDGDILVHEFDKLYNSLLKKCSEPDLKIKIRQKLSQKGFSIEDINILLDKKTEY